MTVHFICRGNANRSIMAEAYLKSLQIPGLDVLSSGTVADLHREENQAYIPGVIDFLAEQGIDKWAKSIPEQLTQDRIDGADITLCMNQKVKDECDQSFVMPGDTIVWNIDDVGEGDRIAVTDADRYRFTKDIYQELVQAIGQLLVQMGLSQSV